MSENITQSSANPTLAARKQTALEIAEKCQQILLQQGAKAVILFGSLTGESPWHWASDIDLAVTGMSEPQRWDAYSVLERISPDW